jgi:hypothetical protein
MELKQRITRTAEVRRRFSPNRRLGAAVKRPGHNNDPRLQQAWPTTTPGKSNA